MISVKQKGDFSKLTKHLNRMKDVPRQVDLDKYGRQGVIALASATPMDSGMTASSWFYEIVRGDTTTTIRFNNSNVVDDWCNIAIILQYGHGTGTGGYVQGRDYINPAIRPIFDGIATAAWKEVTKR